MTGIDVAFEQNKMLYHSRIEFQERQHFRARKDINAAEIN
jgi:hypothetical protein